MLSLETIVQDSNLVAGVLFNLLLLLAIRRFTRASLGTYKQLLTIFAAYDVFLTVLHGVVKPRVIIIGGLFGVVSEAFEDRKITGAYFAFFSVPFALMIINFLYRYWCITHPNLIPLFSNAKFIATIALYPVAEFVAWYSLGVYGSTGQGPEIGRTILCEESGRRFGKELQDGWLIMNYWEDDIFHLDLFMVLAAVDTIMIISFSVASTLGGLTFYYIKRADKISTQAHNLQWKLFIVLCAQTFVPLVFVYLPFGCVLNFAFFRLPVFSLDDVFMVLTSCFPAWDAVIIILLMPDYRAGLLGLLCKKKSHLATVSKITSVMSTTASNVHSSQII